MLAAVYRRPGGADVLSVEEVQTPEPGPGEVRVRLRVAGVNPTDWKSRTRTPPEGFQVPGQDGAGEVDAVGPGVDPGRVGERVWVWFAAARGRRWGTAAQWTVVSARQAVPLPDGVPLELGAGLGIPAMTAHQCLFVDGPLDGATVLVAGGAGAVGNAAVALAARAGARVVATASTPDKADLARAAGAHAVVDYRAPDAAEQVRRAAPDGVSRVVELALGANLALDLAVTAPRAVVSTYADDEVRGLPVRDLMVANVTLRFVLVYGVADADLDAAVAGVSAAVADGALPALPPVRFPLARVGEAHDAVQSGVLGKVLLDLP
ncbi:MAG: NADPH:quinone reductase [Actinomycetota bacterium]|nr:NADPH:quinone reductase [Actinomycetota bacterium]